MVHVPDLHDDSLEGRFQFVASFIQALPPDEGDFAPSNTVFPRKLRQKRGGQRR